MILCMSIKFYLLTKVIEESLPIIHKNLSGDSFTISFSNYHKIDDNMLHFLFINRYSEFIVCIGCSWMVCYNYF